MPPSWPVYRRVALPFLRAYWSRVFNEQSFRFTPPALYRDLFAKAQIEPEARRAQATLGIAFQGLGMSAPAKYREWLKGSW